MRLMRKYIELRQMVKELEPDIEKFELKGTYAAGTRSRNGLRHVKIHCEELRKMIQEKRKINKEKEK